MSKLSFLGTTVLDVSIGVTSQSTEENNANKYIHSQYAYHFVLSDCRSRGCTFLAVPFCPPEYQIRFWTLPWNSLR